MRNNPINRMDKLIKEKRHDVFPTKGNKRRPSQCERCGAVFIKGRWTWEQAGEIATKTTCPACRRIAGNLPAGFLEIKGAFFEEHRDEILNLIDNVEKTEKQTYPLERIIQIQKNGAHTLVTTTGIHIARRIGEALHRSYQGELSLQYADGEKRIRVSWQRD